MNKLTNSSFSRLLSRGDDKATSENVQEKSLLLSDDQTIKYIENSRARRHWDIIRNAVHGKTYASNSDFDKSKSGEGPNNVNESSFTQKDTTSSLYWNLMIVLFLYIMVGVAIYTLCEGWNVRDSFYFIVVTFTTVGYGDMSPSTTATKLFTIAFAAGGICLLGVALGYAGEMVVKMQMESWETFQNKRAEKILEKFSSTDDDKKKNRESINDTSKTHTPQKEHHYRGEPFIIRKICDTVKSKLFNKNDNEESSSFITSVVHATVIMTIGTIAIMNFESWSLIDSLYWTFITFTTIGYGDYQPQSGTTRWFSIFFLPIAVGVISEVLSSIAQRCIDTNMQQVQDQQTMLTNQITIKHLIQMDTDGDGHVDKLEYYCFMLKAMGKVDDALLHQIAERFQTLDADQSGTLEVSDLELLAKREKIKQRMQRRFELSNYKMKLLKLGGSSNVDVVDLENQFYQRQSVELSFSS